MKRRSLVSLLSLALLSTCLSACVTYPRDWDQKTEGDDPYERTNRKIFAFNEGVDDYVLDPLATGWEFITPSAARQSIDRIFINLAFPRRFITNLGQGEFAHAASEVGRFLLNSTMGMGGLLDPATDIGMPLYDEDFGQMFGAWGIGTGPYWVLPVLGPSNPRDAVGTAFDLAMDVRTFLSFTPIFTLAWTGVVQNVNRRALLDQDLEQARAAALDFYVFSRDAYGQRREALVNNHAGDYELGGLSEDALYELDETEYDLPIGESPLPEPEKTPPVDAGPADDWAPPPGGTQSGPSDHWHPPEGDWFDAAPDSSAPGTSPDETP